MTDSKKLVTHVQQALGADYEVALGMRYGTPSLEQALHKLKWCHEVKIY